MKRIMISYAIGIVIFWAIISLVGCAAQPFHRVIHIPAMTVHVYQTADETPGGWAMERSYSTKIRHGMRFSTSYRSNVRLWRTLMR
jgi:hypothetical protein